MKTQTPRAIEKETEADKGSCTIKGSEKWKRKCQESKVKKEKIRIFF